jgi:hypothetical protein
MAESHNLSMLDLLEWVARGPRSYVEVMDVWRQSLPRLTIWEDAVDRGFVTRRRMQPKSEAGQERLETSPVKRRAAFVDLTSSGRVYLMQNGRFLPEAAEQLLQNQDIAP